MSKKAWPGKGISATLALACVLAGCQGVGAPDQPAAGPVIGSTQSGGAQASIHHNGREYILSLGGDAKRRGVEFGLPIPAIAGLKLEEFIEGAGETSASISGAAPLAGFMEAFSRDYSARGYVRKRMIMAEGMASAEWLAGKGVTARLYAMEENGVVTGRIVALRDGK